MSSPILPSFQILTAIADTVARGADLPGAFDALITGLARALDTRASLFQKVSRGWALVTQVRGGLQLSVADLHMALGSISPEESTAAVDLRGIGEGLWTSMPLNDSGGPSIIVLLAGDWTAHKSALDSFAVVLSFALRSVHEREIRRAWSGCRSMRDGRRLSLRLGDLDASGERIVSQVSRSLKADRPAGAVSAGRIVWSSCDARVFRRDGGKILRIEPGSWVVGHVFASGRPCWCPIPGS
jgi:hypothetical protein